MKPTPADTLMPSLTDTLCSTCGFCCDGTLFADVELGRAEAARLESMNVEIEVAEGALLSQPCAALKGKRCSIYAHRPACCRTFECQLLQETRSGAVPVERALERIADAQAQIRRVRALLGELGMGRTRLPLKERCAAALSRDVPVTPEVERLRAELDAAVRTLERTIETTFLGRGT
jgi:hypothetical protein